MKHSHLTEYFCHSEFMCAECTSKHFNTMTLNQRTLLWTSCLLWTCCSIWVSSALCVQNALHVLLHRTCILLLLVLVKGEFFLKGDSSWKHLLSFRKWWECCAVFCPERKEVAGMSVFFNSFSSIQCIMDKKSYTATYIKVYIKSHPWTCQSQAYKVDCY